MEKATNKSVFQIAQELAEVRAELNVLKGIDKKLSAELKSHPDFKEQDFFRMQKQTDFVLVDLKKALNWAKKLAPFLIIVDTKKARSLFLKDAATGSLGQPEKAGFGFSEVEKLVATKQQYEEDS